MKILGLSDLEVPGVYSTFIKSRFKDIDLVVSCGDLPANYLEFVVSSLDIPVFFCAWQPCSTYPGSGR